jgi:hypothetical protein
VGGREKHKPVLATPDSFLPRQARDNREDNSTQQKPVCVCFLSLSLCCSEKKPFFIMSGFARPHMPQRMPRRFYDLYENATLPLATHKQPPDMMPGIAYFQFGARQTQNTFCEAILYC